MSVSATRTLAPGCSPWRLRPVLLSTHLIDEAAGLLERVVVIDWGRIALKSAADDLRWPASTPSSSSPGR